MTSKIMSVMLPFSRKDIVIFVNLIYNVKLNSEVRPSDQFYPIVPIIIN